LDAKSNLVALELTPGQISFFYLNIANNPPTFTRTHLYSYTSDTFIKIERVSLLDGGYFTFIMGSNVNGGTKIINLVIANTLLKIVF
jgi:hypothetical protein